jgi:hypothetical protein
MPTAPKLAAFLWYALVAWFSAQLVSNHLPEGTQLGHFALISAGFGGLVGWTFAGGRAGDTMRAAYGYGLTSIALIVLYCLFYFSFEEMLHRAMSHRYRGPMDALAGCVALMGHNFLIALKVDVVIVLLAGGLIGGWSVEKVGRKWS